MYPYKGGISHYTGLLCRAMRKRHEVYMVSYKLQYPRFLFKREQRDYDNDAFRVEGTEFLINTANPFNWISSAMRIRNLHPDLVIIQWWHPYFAPCYWTLRRLLGNIPVLYLCHNVFPHERFPLDRVLTKLVLRSGNLFILHSTQDEGDLRSIKPDAVCRRTALPTYDAFRLQGLTRQEARNQLNLDEKEKVLLFFGLVREYKGLPYLLDAIPKISRAVPDVKLLIAGDFGGEKDWYDNRIAELGIRDCVDAHDGYIPDRQVEKYFVACDVVVLPYISATQSAVVQTAYGFGKPVIVTNVGGLPEVVKDGETGYIVPPKDPVALAEAVIRFLDTADWPAFTAAIRRENYRFSWERMVDVIENLARNKHTMPQKKFHLSIQGRAVKLMWTGGQKKS